jgi:hypothetical protein
MWIIKEIVEYKGVVSPTALDAETTVIDITETRYFIITGYITLKEMAVGDTVILREYCVIEEGGPLEKFTDETYKDAQAVPLICMPIKVLRYGYRFTLTQSAGTLRSFAYQFIKLVLEKV